MKSKINQFSLQSGDILPHGENLVPVLLGVNVIVGSAILLIGAKINPETKDAEIK